MAKENVKKRVSLRLFWILSISLIVFPIIFVALVAFGVFGPLPETVKLENPPIALASEVISEDGVVLGKFFNENRTVIDYKDLSPNVINALVATEDSRFYDHSGVDFKALFRVLGGVLTFHRSGGGSTLSQQLAKNLFPRKRFHGIWVAVQKAKEWITATRLERLYTKEEILAMYLNTVDFGNNAIGIKSAASTYFNKAPDALTVNESAMLIGMLKAPSYYSPVNHVNRTKERRNTVLSQMEKYDYLKKDEFASLSRAPIDLRNFKAESHNEGKATYLREYVRNLVKRWAETHGKDIDIYTDGLKIYTGINSHMQAYAEQAVQQHMSEMQKKFYETWKGRVPWEKNPEIIMSTVKRSERYCRMKNAGIPDDKIMASFYRKRKMMVFDYNAQNEKEITMSPLDSIKYYKYFLQTGFMAMDPSSGQIRIWVGGINFKYFKYDHISPPETKMVYGKDTVWERGGRQVGSTFKPIVYSRYIMDGNSPCTEVANVPIVFDKYDNWSPKNSDNKYGGEKNLYQGLAGSINCVTAWVISQAGIDRVVDLAHAMGIKSHIDVVPSICLGVMDANVYDMVSAFNVFNNKGLYVEPQIITRIEDKNGKVLETFIPPTKPVMNDKYSYIMLDMLKGVVNHGTGYRLRGTYKVTAPTAGKTGTTQNNSDGWFMAMIPQLTGGIWVGAEDRAVHFNSMKDGQGAAMALPIWAYFIQKVYADKSCGIDPLKDWERPKEDLGVEIDCKVYDETNASEEYVP